MNSSNEEDDSASYDESSSEDASSVEITTNRTLSKIESNREEDEEDEKDEEDETTSYHEEEDDTTSYHESSSEGSLPAEIATDRTVSRIKSNREEDEEDEKEDEDDTTSYHDSSSDGGSLLAEITTDGTLSKIESNREEGEENEKKKGDDTTSYHESSSEEGSLSAEMTTDRTVSKIDSHNQEEEERSSSNENSSSDVSLLAEMIPDVATVKIEPNNKKQNESFGSEKKRNASKRAPCPPLDLQQMPRSGTICRTLPTSTSISHDISHNIIRGEEKYLSKLKRLGQQELKNERKKRKTEREKLRMAGFHDVAENIPILQTSSSDDAYLNKTTALPLIDWENAEWGNEESLYQHMNSGERSKEVCSLIGWATHLLCDTFCPQNNLLDFPNTPLPPSLLNNINVRAATASHSQSISWRNRTFKIRKKTSSGKRPLVYWLKRRLKPKWTWQHGIDDEDYQWMKKNSKPVEKGSIKVPVVKNDLSLPLDISGQVALGMVVEEVITASLMPFARLHTANCRKKADAFHDWTMPPEEAILTCPETSNLPSASNAKNLLKWCNSRGLDYKFVKKNSRIYSKILAMNSFDPTDLPSLSPLKKNSIES